MMGKVKKVTSNHLFLPLFALALLLVFNAFATPGFFAIEFQNGQFYGRIIDILNRASILVILSMGASTSPKALSSPSPAPSAAP